jgi:hypothetical protein
MTETGPMPTSDRNFILQQGLPAPSGTNCTRLSSALRFQSRLVGLLALVGTISQSASVFAALAALLWWSALLPRLNPFDFAYNHTLGRRSGAPMLGEAPAPRRFAQGMAATLATASAVSLAVGLRMVAVGLQAFFLLAVTALVFGRFCLGSFIYYLARGRAAFARRTLPWGRGD